MKRGLILAAGAVALLLVAGARSKLAATPAVDQAGAPQADPTSSSSIADTAAQWASGAASFTDAINPFSVIEGYTMGNASADTNVAAFEDTIAHSEGTDRAPDPYAVCYGYRHTIQDFSDHPAITGEWMGEPLDKLGPRYVGLVSTAAGKYQINRPTWLDCKRALALTDFTPASQDKAAAWLIQQAGALDDVKSGNFDQAVAKCSGRWASLPGSTAGQPTRQLAELEVAFTDAGGVLA